MLPLTEATVNIPIQYKISPAKKILSPIKHKIETAALLTGNLEGPRIVGRVIGRVSKAAKILLKNPVVNRYFGPISDLSEAFERFVTLLMGINSVKDLSQIYKHNWKRAALSLNGIAVSALGITMSLEALGYISLEKVKNFISTVPVWKSFGSLAFGGIFDLLVITLVTPGLLKEVQNLKDQKKGSIRTAQKIVLWTTLNKIFKKSSIEEKKIFKHIFEGKADLAKRINKINELTCTINQLHLLKENTHADQDKVQKDLQIAESKLYKIEAKVRCYKVLSSDDFWHTSEKTDTVVSDFFNRKIKKWEIRKKAQNRQRIGTGFSIAQKVTLLTGAGIRIGSVFAGPAAAPLAIVGALFALVEVGCAFTNFFIKESVKKIENKIPYLDFNSFMREHDLCPV